MIVTGEASFRTTYDHRTSKFLTRAGVPNTHLRLEKAGVHGNGHMMMLESSSAAIAGVIADWLDANVKQVGGIAVVTGFCPSPQRDGESL